MWMVQASVTLRQVVRDKTLHSIFGCGLLILLLVPAFSMFSMKQIQETAITLCLSATSLLTLIITVLLGGSSIWRDIEKKYIFLALGMPLPRLHYLMGKFIGIFIIIQMTVLFMASFSALAVQSVLWFSLSEKQVLWGNFFLAFAFIGCKYTLLTAFAMMFSSIGTSFFLPVFGSLAVFFAGEATQDVFEFIHSSSGESLPEAMRWLCSLLYYILPNFEAFDFSVHAVYSLPLEWSGVGLSILYFLIYISILMVFTTWIFNRRELV